ncbi:uncharacterized protein [Haliaeetus albicilla]|uniref:uncharacterized protein n=1 Tax=Haliaeetus albicilla TaxID=8969 RepID=UPI0037E9AF54
MSVNEAQLGTLAKRMWKMSASTGAKEEPPEGATAVEGTDNGTDRERRNTSILEIVAAYESERNEKLVDVRCCADIPPCFIPPLSTQVLASGMQIYPRGAIILSRALAGPGDCRYCSAPRSSTVDRAGVWSQSCHGATMISLRRREERGCPERPSLCPAGHGRGETTQLLHREKQGVLLQTQARSPLRLLQEHAGDQRVVSLPTWEYSTDMQTFFSLQPPSRSDFRHLHEILEGRHLRRCWSGQSERLKMSTASTRSVLPNELTGVP